MADYLVEQTVGQKVVPTAVNSVGLMVDQMVGQRVVHLADLMAEHSVDWMAG